MQSFPDNVEDFKQINASRNPLKRRVSLQRSAADGFKEIHYLLVANAEPWHLRGEEWCRPEMPSRVANATCCSG